jgi:cytochrome c oxidase subunit 2
MRDLLGLPLDASAHGYQIDDMIGLVHVLMALLFVGWGIYFVYALVRFRRSKHPRADYVGAKGKTSTYVEGGVAVFEAVLLIGFAIPLWSSVVNDIPPTEGSTVVRVVAEQFAWNIHYPGDDGIFGRTDINLITAENPLGLDRSDPAAMDDIFTINQMNIPIDKPVVAFLTSKDVIHSFAIPVMRVKQDVIPGERATVWFEPKIAGEYEIACAQLCGLGHYRMRGFVTVMTHEEYKEWLEEEAAYLDEY